ncbi:MAG: TolC family protein [Candidatus Sumerlaeia bacterium]|nr:TolC family protein [Candidatus Sumerlaeia bacterium]
MSPPKLPSPTQLSIPTTNQIPPISRNTFSDSITSTSLSIHEAINLAITRSPQLQADYKNLEAMLLDIPLVTSLEDPMLEVVTEEDFQGPGNERENMVVLRQTFPWFGKRRLMGLISGSAAAFAIEEYRLAVLETRRDVHTAWWNAVYSKENAKLLREEQQLLLSAEEATRSLYQSGESDQSALIRLQTEQAIISGMLQETLGAEQAARHELARLLAMSIPETELLGNLDAGSSISIPPLNDLVALAMEYRPELAGISEERKLASLQEQLARKDYYPDFTVGAGAVGMGMKSSSYYEFDSDDRTDRWQASVGINIPLPNARRKAAVRQARIRGEEAELRHGAVSDQILQQVAGTTSLITSLQQQSVLYSSSIIPLAEQAFHATRVAYQSGNATYSDLIDVQRSLVSARREHLGIQRDLSIFTAELERSIGIPLNSTNLQEDHSK